MQNKAKQKGKHKQKQKQHNTHTHKIMIILNPLKQQNEYYLSTNITVCFKIKMTCYLPACAKFHVSIIVVQNSLIKRYSMYNS